MPELPEVETIKRGLNQVLTDKKIKSFWSNWPKKVEPSFKIVKSKIVGKKIKQVSRRAKILIFELSSSEFILIHLKLTGQLIYSGGKVKNQPNKFTHVVFYLDGGAKLFFNDSRKFGWIKIAKSEEVIANSFIKKLGPEPFKGLSLKVFKEVLSRSGRPIKVVLMDQSRISGIGNIYANDALWLSAINPQRPANNLQPEEQKKLYEAIITVLKAGIKYGGASELAFVTPDGTEGNYQNHTLVYGHEGEPCERCHKSVIKKFFLGGRGTYFCPKCQK